MPGFDRAAQLLLNAVARLGDALDVRKVRRGLVNQRLDDFEEDAAEADRAGRGAGLDQHLQFPVARAPMVVLERGLQRKHQLTHVAVRPQSQIDAIAGAFRRHHRQQLRQTLGEFENEFLV